MISAIPGKYDYYADTNGNIYSKRPRGPRVKAPMVPRILHPNENNRGYYDVTLCLPEPRKYLVHQLILEAFVGPKPLGLECRHLDGDPLNNRLDNLLWGTHQENIADATKEGRMGGFKLVIDDVRQILDLIKITRMNENDIGKLYGVSAGTIRAIKEYRTWKYIRRL